MAPALSISLISVVLPVLDEEPTVRELHERLRSLDLVADLEIIYVDDGSTDGSWDTIGACCRLHPQTRGIRLRRNFGKSAALAAGTRAAQGDVIVLMDSDLQDDPGEIPRLLEALEEHDIVVGWRKHREDPISKRLPSAVFNFMVNRLTAPKLHDHNSGLKAFRAEFFREVPVYGEFHRFLPVLGHARGFRVTEVPVRHHPRRYGKSKYGVTRFARGLLDLLTMKALVGYGQRPQHLLGAFGGLSFLVGALGLTYLAGFWVATQWDLIPYRSIVTRPLLIYSLTALIVGAQFGSLAFVAALMNTQRTRWDDQYSILEEVGENEQVEEPAESVTARDERRSGSGQKALKASRQ